MKTKELKALALKIANCEKVLQSEEATKEEKTKAKEEIIKLSSSIKNFNDMIKLDELVQELI